MMKEVKDMRNKRNIFGERLNEIRKDKGITQLELANKLNVTKQSISSYENGKTEANDEIKLKIAKFLNTTVSYLIGETNNPKQNQEPTYQELYTKLIEQNPRDDIHFYNVEGLTQHDFEIIQHTIDMLKLKNKQK